MINDAVKDYPILMYCIVWSAGAAAMTVAACMKDSSRRNGRAAVVICCGGNVSDATFDSARDLAVSTAQQQGSL